MYDKPQISVIIAASNNAEHIGECLDSILCQSFQTVEVIVVDVCSTDGTKEILAELAKEDDRVVFLADSMKSKGHAKNMGMNHARAPYLLFVEPEDYLYRNSLEYMSKGLDDNPDMDMFSCEIESFGFDSFGRTKEDRDRMLHEANIRDHNSQERNSRMMRCWMFDTITLYRSSYLEEKGILHYAEPGYGRQDSAFQFLAMAKGTSAMSVEVQYARRMEIEKEKITDIQSAMDLSAEFRFLKEKLQEDSHLWQKFRLVFWQAYYDRNMLIYEQLSDEVRAGLSKRMQADIKIAMYRKEYGRDHFDVTVRDEMNFLMKSTDEFNRYQENKLRLREEKRDEALQREAKRSERSGKSEEMEIEYLSEERVWIKEAKKRKYHLDREWLLDEMARDMAPLRMLLGASPDEMGELLGISASTYKSLETGRKEVSWDQYLALLFVFRYNDRTSEIVDKLGLYPEPLQIRMKRGVVIYG